MDRASAAACGQPPDDRQGRGRRGRGQPAAGRRRLERPGRRGDAGEHGHDRRGLRGERAAPVVRQRPHDRDAGRRAASQPQPVQHGPAAVGPGLGRLRRGPFLRLDGRGGDPRTAHPRPGVGRQARRAARVPDAERGRAVHLHRVRRRGHPGAIPGPRPLAAARVGLGNVEQRVYERTNPLRYDPATNSAKSSKQAVAVSPAEPAEVWPAHDGTTYVVVGTAGTPRYGWTGKDRPQLRRRNGQRLDRGRGRQDAGRPVDQRARRWLPRRLLCPGFRNAGPSTGPGSGTTVRSD